MRYFEDHELWCSCCHKMQFQDGFKPALDELREICGFPFVPTSCCRCSEHNDRVGGHPRSLHVIDNKAHKCDTLAIDLKIVDSYRRGKLIRLALYTNWSVGVASNFIHLDKRSLIGLPQVLYHYKR
jgi:hypothetical protein